jgi:hypothetical protein
MPGDMMEEKEIEEVQMDGTVVTKKVRVTPAEIVRKMLDDDAYDLVRAVLYSSDEKKLSLVKPTLQGVHENENAVMTECV